MKSDLLSHTDWAVLPQITLIIFMLVFVTYAVWVYSPRMKETMNRRAMMPLDDANPIDPISSVESHKETNHG